MTREEAIRIIETVFQDEYVYKYYDSITHQALNMAIEALSADAVQGEWQKVEEQPYFRKHYDTVCCSVCRKKGNRKWNYCPMCGARMKGGDDK